MTACDVGGGDQTGDVDLTAPDAAAGDRLAGFSPPTIEWFRTTFGAPTEAQARAWPSIRDGGHTLLCAPTGSGKTLAAFLAAIDRLSTSTTEPAGHTSVVYISPLRALAVDVDKNLRAPLRGIALAAQRLGLAAREPTVGIRTGDTDAAERRRLARYPPEILITTPESLYLMLTSAVRETLAHVDTVIVDEIHAVAATKRGSHLAVTLERLDHWCRSQGSPPPQRVGLSATQRPLTEIAHFLGGNEVDSSTGEVRGPRPVTIVDAGVRKPLELQVVVPVDDMANPGEGTPGGGGALGGDGAQRSIWPAIHPALLDLIKAHRSTIVFVNARRLAERLATRLNELELDGLNRAAEAEGRPPVEGTELVLAHHGSLSRTRRLSIEDDLKAGRVRALVATSSLELGIDMGAVDLVIQVESPGAVSRGLQRVGRAGHQVGAPSSGRFFPKHRGDLVETAVVVARMEAGEIETTRFVRNPLDVAAQQLVAACALDEWDVADLTAVLRGAAPFGEMSDDVLTSVLDLLDGRYPSEDFAELRPRIVWDRATGRVRGRDGAQRLAVTNAGTIPDRGLFGVHLPDGTRVGELDEEMVYESRAGETFLLGATTWRIEDITSDRVVVTPAPGLPGKMPFWHGEGPGRPIELGRAVGAFMRTIRDRPRGEAMALLADRHHLDPSAAANLLAYLDDQAAVTGVVPDDRTIVIERFRDEIGDWRVCVLTPFGARVHAPWALAIRHRLEAGGALDVEIMWSDDGIIFRLPDGDDTVSVDELMIDPDEVAGIVVAALPNSALFASRFREASARALLLPRRRVDRRTPLWQQRQRAGTLLEVAARHPEFPMLLETTRECINDVFDVPSLVDLMRSVRERRVRVVAVETTAASPFASSLLFSWIAQYMYEGDAPLAERRAAALALDADLLRDLLGTDELRSLLDAEVVAAVEDELQCRAEGHRARTLDEVHDLLRRLGPLRVDEVEERYAGDTAEAAAHLDELLTARRAISVRVGGEERVAAAADAARLRDALGVALPPGLAAADTEPVERPLRDVLERHARTHGPFTVAEFVARWGASGEAVTLVARELAAEGRLVAGEFRPGGRGAEWCDAEVMRRIRRRTLAALRREIEAVDAPVLARFLPAWHGIGDGRRGADAVADAVAQLEGVPLVASSLERDVLAVRVDDYRSADLDELVVGGALLWVGAGAIGATDGRVRLVYRDAAPDLLRRDDPGDGPDGETHEALRRHLAERGASFWSDLGAAVAAAGLPYDDATVLTALWDLVWAGEVTNDSLAPLRAWLSSGGRAPKAGSRRARGLRAAGPPAAAGRWSLVRHGAPTARSSAVASARQLLERYGVLTREMARAEGVLAGFAGVYPVLRTMEEQGQARRGYFVSGLGAAQFALPAAVDRLRRYRESGSGQTVVLAATDPVQPYGAVLAWPESTGRPTRSAGARVVIHDGACVAWLDRSCRSVITFASSADLDALDLPAERPADDSVWVEALGGLVDAGRVAKIEIATVDGVRVAEHRSAAAFESAGFVASYRGVIRRGR